MTTSLTLLLRQLDNKKYKIYIHMTTYFISGHTDLTLDQFNSHYKSKITDAASDSKSLFVMGDAPGVDFMAQKLLLDLLGDAIYERICVYHRGDKPYMLADEKIKRIGGFKSHDNKDRQMTLDSNVDIAFVRSSEESKKLYGSKYNPNRKSGTEKNLERRTKS